MLVYLKEQVLKNIVVLRYCYLQATGNSYRYILIRISLEQLSPRGIVRKINLFSLTVVKMLFRAFHVS